MSFSGLQREKERWECELGLLEVEYENAVYTDAMKVHLALEAGKEPPPRKTLALRPHITDIEARIEELEKRIAEAKAKEAQR
jgi:hypothetical protein